MLEQNDSINIVEWVEIREDLSKINPILTEKLDQLDLKKQDKFVLVDYPFGSDILLDGEFRLPSNDGFVYSISHDNISKEVRSILDYSYLPIGIVMNNIVEVYYETPQRTISDKICQPGFVLGLWEYFDKESGLGSTLCSNLSSGARSIFLLPKISDSVSHARLRRALNITSNPPEQMIQHRKLFAEIESKMNGENAWKCRMLYLGQNVVEKLESKYGEPALLDLCKQAWSQSYNCRRYFESNIYWEKILKVISDSNVYLQSKVFPI